MACFRQIELRGECCGLRPNQDVGLTKRLTKNRIDVPTNKPTAPATQPRSTITGASLDQRDHSATPPSGCVIRWARMIETGTSQYCRIEQNPAVIDATTNHTSRMAEAWR